jgi:Xaa-Pro aminopeptidase
MLQSGASGHAYEPIVATDNNATTIHYTSNNAALKNKHLLLLDVGAAYGLYAADISRTYALKKPSPRLVEVYDAVLSVQKKLMKMIRPGLTMRQIESMTEELVGDALVGLGLIKNKTSKNIRKYYPHAVSHFLGLDVHDAADYDMPLSAGMVITVEPGIYIAAEKIGVRIEDDVVITKNGIRNLSSAISNNLLYYL